MRAEPQVGLVPSEEETGEDSLLPLHTPCHVRTGYAGSHPQARQRVLTRARPCRSLSLDPRPPDLWGVNVCGLATVNPPGPRYLCYSSLS